MALAERAKLVAELSLDDKLTPSVKKIEGRLGAFSGAINRNLGRGVDALISKAASLGEQAFTGGIAALKKDAVVAAQTAAVIKSTGGAAGVTSDQVAKLADSMSTYNAVQDDVVQGAENVILRFTNIHKDIFPAVTQAAIDMAAATGTDASQAALKLGRAIDNPLKGLTALTRAGITFNDAETKQIKSLVTHGKLQQAQAIILDRVKQKYADVAHQQALADPSRGLSVSIEKLQKAFASGLLPVVDKVQVALTKAFSDPATLATITKIGDTIGGLFTDQNISAVASGLQVAASAVSGAIGLFNQLPPEIKALAIGAFAVNKITGGAITGIAGALGSIVGKGISKIFAANVTVIGTNVTGPGGGAGVPGSPIASGASKLQKGLAAASIVADIAGVIVTQQQISGEISQQGNDLKTQLAAGIKVQTPEQLQTSLAAVEQGINSIQANPLNVLVQGSALDSLKEMRASLQAQIHALNGDKPTSALGKGFGPAVAGALTKALPVLKIPKLNQSLDRDIARLASLQGKLHNAKESGDKGRASVLKGRVDNLGRRIDSEKRALAAVQQQVKTATTTGLNNLGGIERTGNSTLANAMGNVADRVVAAIYAARPVINSTTIVRSTVRNGRGGPSGGSSNTNRVGHYGTVPS